MSLAGSILLLFLFADASPGPSLPYFTHMREVRIAQPDRQNFFIVDAELWAHARPDLGDLRLYDGESPVQYTIQRSNL